MDELCPPYVCFVLTAWMSPTIERGCPYLEVIVVANLEKNDNNDNNKDNNKNDK